jgi:hypothetical protein
MVNMARATDPKWKGSFSFRKSMHMQAAISEKNSGSPENPMSTEIGGQDPQYVKQGYILRRFSKKDVLTIESDDEDADPALATNKRLKQPKYIF